MHVIFANCIPFSLNLVFQALICSGYILGLLSVLSEIKDAPRTYEHWEDRFNIWGVLVAIFPFPLLEIEEIMHAQKKKI